VFSKGADVDALRDSAGRMTSFGREVDLVRAHGQRAVSAMQRAWQGPDLQHLVGRWRRVEHDLHRISTEFDQLSRRLQDNADLQHRSSGSPVVATGTPRAGEGSAIVPALQGHLGRPAGPGVESAAGLIGWGPDRGRPLVSPGVPHAAHAVGWGHWIGRPSVGADAFEPLSFGPVVPAGLAAAAAQDLGLPIR
jgi:uncharacterized protein YukE